MTKSKLKKVYKLRQDDMDMRDKVFCSTLFKSPAELPQTVDLRPKMSPIVDQGQLGSCTANAIASGLREYLELQAGPQLMNLSRLWLYWQERNAEGTVSQDSGAYIRDGMKVLQQMGCAPEADFPYDITKFTQTPSTQSVMDAANFKITEYHRVLDLNALKASLAEEMPVVIGITVYPSFESQKVAQTGIVPMPSLLDRSRGPLGGHAVLAVGYTKIKSTKYVICRNSWGIGWGDKGYFYLPEAFFAKYVTDMWTGK